MSYLFVSEPVVRLEGKVENLQEEDHESPEKEREMVTNGDRARKKLLSKKSTCSLVSP